MTLRAFLCSLLGGFSVLVAVPAQADISALYQIETWDEDDGPNLDIGMTIEVNDAGDGRIHITGRTSYLLVKQGEVYVVTRGIDGTYAESLSDLDGALKARGEVAGISFKMFDEFGSPEVAKTGKAKVDRWTGNGFAMKDYSYENDKSPDLIMSVDQELAALAPAFRAAFAGKYGIARTISLAGLPFAFYLASPEVEAVFDQGTPIKLGMMELSKISNQPIAAGRFALPDRVLSQEEIEAYLEPFEWAPEFDRQPKG